MVSQQDGDRECTCHVPTDYVDLPWSQFQPQLLLSGVRGTRILADMNRVKI